MAMTDTPVEIAQNFPRSFDQDTFEASRVLIWVIKYYSGSKQTDILSNCLRTFNWLQRSLYHVRSYDQLKYIQGDYNEWMNVVTKLLLRQGNNLEVLELALTALKLMLKTV